MRTFTAGLLTAAALTLGACSLPGPGAGSSAPPPVAPPPASTTPTTATGSADPTAGPTDPASASPSPSGSATDQLGTPAGTRTGSADGQRVVLTLYPVVRSGTTSEIEFTLSADVPRTKRVQVAQLLSDGNYQESDASGLAADGLTLVDGRHSKLYLVASDGQGTCLCSRDLASVFLVENEPVVLSATFAAPPADVTTVDVRVPNFGTLRNIPVQ